MRRAAAPDGRRERRLCRAEPNGAADIRPPAPLRPRGPPVQGCACACTEVRSECYAGNRHRQNYRGSGEGDNPQIRVVDTTYATSANQAEARRKRWRGSARPSIGFEFPKDSSVAAVQLTTASPCLVAVVDHLADRRSERRSRADRSGRPGVNVAAEATRVPDSQAALAESAVRNSQRRAAGGGVAVRLFDIRGDS